MNQQDQFETNNPSTQSISENAMGAEPLADLPLTAAQAEATKAGDGKRTSSGEFPYIISFQQN